MRGKFMQEAVPEGTGGMSAIIGLDDASIAKACEESAEGQVVSPVTAAAGERTVALRADETSGR